jgi:hypothetical protein
MSLPRLRLSQESVVSINALVDRIAGDWDSIESTNFLTEAAVMAHDLPDELRRFISAARIHEKELFAVSGWPVDDVALGPTPRSWQAASSGRTLRHEIVLALIASLLGDPFGMSALQDGRVVNHIIPVAGAESTVTAFSSTGGLAWHTENAGLDCRPDYLAFLCLRNPDQVPTTLSSPVGTGLAEATVEVLREPRFLVLALGPTGPVQVTTPVLFGSKTTPYIRIDPVYMKARDGDAEAAAALTDICARLTEATRSFGSRQGDIYVLDNYQLVHGRPSFRPRYDGTDRWLIRVKVAKDIRRSREFRDSAAGRVVRLTT